MYRTIVIVNYVLLKYGWECTGMTSRGTSLHPQINTSSR